MSYWHTIARGSMIWVVQTAEAVVGDGPRRVAHLTLSMTTPQRLAEGKRTPHAGASSLRFPECDGAALYLPTSSLASSAALAASGA